MNDDLFTKEDSTILKGIAICLMVYYNISRRKPRPFFGNARG